MVVINTSLNDFFQHPSLFQRPLPSSNKAKLPLLTLDGRLIGEKAIGKLVEVVAAI